MARKVHKDIDKDLREIERGTVQHIICECKIQAQREYKRRHDTVAKLVYWKLCEKHNLERKGK